MNNENQEIYEPVNMQMPETIPHDFNPQTDAPATWTRNGGKETGVFIADGSFVIASAVVMPETEEKIGQIKHFFGWENNDPFFERAQAITYKQARNTRTDVTQRIPSERVGANAKLYDQIIQKMEIYSDDEAGYETLEGREAGEFLSPEDKDEVIESWANALTVKRLVPEYLQGVDRIKYLMNQNENRFFECFIGGSDADTAPIQFVLEFAFLDKHKRGIYRSNAQGIFLDNEGEKEITTIGQNFSYKQKCLAKWIVGGSGVFVDAVGNALTDKNKNQFSAKIPGFWTIEIVDTVIASYSNTKGKK